LTINKKKDVDGVLGIRSGVVNIYRGYGMKTKEVKMGKVNKMEKEKMVYTQATLMMDNIFNFFENNPKGKITKDDFNEANAIMWRQTKKMCKEDKVKTKVDYIG
jgi:hypothetical protein